jgi:methionyl-tRNA synthetase
MEAQASHKALEHLWDVVGDANRYVDAQAPWTLRKTNPARMATVLWTLAETVRHLAILVQPFMPGSAERLLDQLALSPNARGFATLGHEGQALRPGTPLPSPQGIFPRHAAAEAG